MTAPELIGNQNAAVVEHWKTRAEQALAELARWRSLGTWEEVARTVAMVKGEQERDADQAELELLDLARLALEGSARDVEMFVHRLAYRHRSRSIGQALKSIDKVPAVSLRAAGDVGAAP